MRRQGERGQALILLTVAATALLLGAGVLAALGSALLGRGRMQRAADLGAISAARSMQDDFQRLFEPPTLRGGAPNPLHLSKDDYLRRARAAGLEGARLNGADPRETRIEFPNGTSFAPNRARVVVLARARVDVAAGSDVGSVPIRSSAEAELGSTSGSPYPEVADGGGYNGPLAYRQGKPMRPDVARAFDRLAAAARADGVDLIITSAYRSDAEQAELYKQHPDPKWVAPPGKSLHRYGTELDLGPPSAYGWLERSSERFHFTKRYAWEPFPVLSRSAR
jgi:hypothetical protein